MYSFFTLIDDVLTFYLYIIIINVILSWLISFRVINISNQIVRMFYEASWRLTEPVYARVRNILPNLGGIDISPVIVSILIIFLKNLLIENRLVF
tara:strand:+ start:275 stop:559 length:285 start_codon:yes stop_codon:yes gene_type:complete